MQLQGLFELACVFVILHLTFVTILLMFFDEFNSNSLWAGFIFVDASFSNIQNKFDVKLNKHKNQISAAGSKAKIITHASILNKFPLYD